MRDGFKWPYYPPTSQFKPEDTSRERVRSHVVSQVKEHREKPSLSKIEKEERQ